MSKFETIAVSPEVSEVFSVGTPDDRTVLHIRPPEDGPGVEQGLNLMKSIHHVDVESGLLSETVNSKLSSFEMWYQNEQLDFYFVVPDEEEEDHYRRQITGYFTGVQIQEETLKKNQFPNIEPGRSIAVTRLGAERHVFEPLWMVGDGGDDGVEDPYQPILNEVDSKTDLSVIIQVLYKPLPRSWESVNGTELREYSRRLEQEGILGQRLFGKITRKINDETLQQKGADSIRKQIGEPAFATEVRMAVVADTDEMATRELDGLVDLFTNTYQGQTGQRLTPVNTEDAEDLLARMISRRLQGRENLPQGIRGRLKMELMGTTPFLICTAPELSGLVHLPNRDSVTVTGVNYTKALVEGTLPPNAKRFKPVSQQEKEKALREEQNQARESDSRGSTEIGNTDSST